MWAAILLGSLKAALPGYAAAGLIGLWADNTILQVMGLVGFVVSFAVWWACGFPTKLEHMLRPPR